MSKFFLEWTNPDFLDWKQQDQLLVSWILSSMTETILSRMVNCDTTTQIWKTLQQYCGTKSSQGKSIQDSTSEN